ncbi:MAG: ABC transporter ATP-binding protein [Syntrophales bacterium]|nr:ABC transporter ATP-binding protein [Syntrophales bacterium]MDD5232421.1 ABC transporter ATP-binding protein [Syntrophales bacterium]MDD5531953.1 ABC transporter ATP-binding protein [Syntrophales bacterium]
MSRPYLVVSELSISYGNISAVRKVSFRVDEGEIVTLIGANGAGKSSILRALSGLIPFSGTVMFRGTDLGNMPPDRIVALGVAHVPEGRGIFGNLSVLENLRLATWQRKDGDGVRRDLDRVLALFPRLNERKEQPGGTLSGGEQQMLALGRAMMSRGNLLLLDEPSMGLAPVLVRDIFRVLRELNGEGTTILLVEQNAHMALQTASRGYVLETGRIVLTGTGRELDADPRVKEAYLGK